VTFPSRASLALVRALALAAAAQAKVSIRVGIPDQNVAMFDREAMGTRSGPVPVSPHIQRHRRAFSTQAAPGSRPTKPALCSIFGVSDADAPSRFTRERSQVRNPPRPYEELLH